MTPCDNCGQEFEPVRTRWLCPHCKYKASCCEGEPQSPLQTLEASDDV